jgi:Txe/YoeB family toxin of Txe-Axe toxin-antitoxin module
MKQNKELLQFIKEARSRGFSDLEIKKPLIQNGWTNEKIEQAFAYLNPKFENKNQICLFLSDEVLKQLKKRAKKNMFSLGEQIEDILRRSCVNTSKSSEESEKLDDLLVGIFSRKIRKKK